MRICVISSQVFACPPMGYSGLEYIAWHIAKGLAAKGHQIALVAPEGSYCPGAEIIPTGPPGAWPEQIAYGGNGKDWPGYWKHLLAFDAIIDHSWSKFAYILKMEGRLLAPVLGVCHAPINTMYQQLPPVPKPCMVCISQDQASHLQALFNAQARVAYNGVDVDTYAPIDIPRSDRFLFLARFSSIKGPDLAIEACKAAGVGLDLIGDTTITNEPELLAKCRAMADGKQIRIIGNQSRNACVWWYSQAHALLHLNAKFREPFGLAPVEAQLGGCPVIAWDYGAMRETVAHGKSGFLVASMQDVVNLIKDKAIDSLDRKECSELAKRFSIDTMVCRYETLCREAIDGGW